VDKLLQIDQGYEPSSHHGGEIQRLQQVMNQPSLSKHEVLNSLANMKRKHRKMGELRRRQR
jgi:hypothetical protein